VPWGWWNNADSDLGPLTLSQAGPYYLQIEGQAAALVDYKFRLMDALQAPAVPLVFGQTYGTNLTVVPGGWLSITGSYVAASLRSYAVQDDWRLSQTIAGTRVDTAINFGKRTGGALGRCGVE